MLTVSPTPTETTDPCEESATWTVISLGAATAVFLISTIVLAIALVLVLVRQSWQRLESPPKSADDVECRYWANTSEIPSLQEEISSSKRPNIWAVGTNTATTFNHSTDDNTRDARGTHPQHTHIKPKRTAPPPPKGRSKFRRGNKKPKPPPDYEIPHHYIQPRATKPPPHEYKELDIATVQPPGKYTQVITKSESKHSDTEYKELDITKVQPPGKYTQVIKKGDRTHSDTATST